MTNLIVEDQELQDYFEAKEIEDQKNFFEYLDFVEIIESINPYD